MSKTPKNHTETPKTNDFPPNQRRDVRDDSKPSDIDGRAQPHEILTSPAIQGAVGAASWGQYAGNADLGALTRELRDRARAVSGGDLRYVEAMLLSQAATLGTIFVSLARRAASQEYLEQFRTSLSLALKAQAQCRATLETLAQIKNPPIVYARQANVTTGPQQVNNGNPSRTREIETEQTQQSGGTHELLPDARASGIASGANPSLEALGEIHRAKDGRG